VVESPQQAGDRPAFDGERAEQVTQLPVAEPAIVSERGLGT
jgi:hypothetical protein